jgi:KDO2-lipid IV(A) lauroyltransferase
MTAPAAAAFALRFNANVIPLVARRLGPARIEVVLEKRLDLPSSGDRQADILALTTTFNAILERWIRDRPGEWLWLHRRWPKPDRVTPPAGYDKPPGVAGSAG